MADYMLSCKLQASTKNVRGHCPVLLFVAKLCNDKGSEINLKDIDSVCGKDTCISSLFFMSSLTPFLLLQLMLTNVLTLSPFPSTLVHAVKAAVLLLWLQPHARQNISLVATVALVSTTGAEGDAVRSQNALVSIPLMNRRQHMNRGALSKDIALIGKIVNITPDCRRQHDW